MFENSNKIQKVILSISFVVFLFIILIGWFLIGEDSGLMGTFVALMVLAITTIFFYRLWAAKK